MAKRKKPVIDLTQQELTFEIDDMTAKLISFNPNTMTLLVNLYEGGKKIKTESGFPFAHLPKQLKQQINPK